MEEDYFVVEALFPDFKILNKSHINKTAHDLKKIREENILNKRLKNHGMPMTYEERTAIVGDYDNEVTLAELEAYFQRSLSSILKILESSGSKVPETEIYNAMVEVKERRKREGVNAKVYEPKLFKLDDLEDFDSWHYVYQLILKWFVDTKEFKNKDDIETFLDKLRPADLALHQGYKRRTVEVNYDEEDTQYAYLFRYSALYEREIAKILDKVALKENLLNIRNLDFSFIGAGPGFEGLSVIDWAKKNNLYPKVGSNLKIRLFDINKWSTGRSIIKREFEDRVDEQSDSKLEIEEINKDFMNVDVSVFKDCTALIFQNCFNEILKNYEEEKVIERINLVLSTIKEGSSLIIIDRLSYGVTESLLETIKLTVALESKLKVSNLPDSKNQKMLQLEEIPIILRESLYNKRLNASRTINSTYLVIKKI